jgi:hypothetical protein
VHRALRKTNSTPCRCSSNAGYRRLPKFRAIHRPSLRFGNDVMIPLRDLLGSCSRTGERLAKSSALCRLSTSSSSRFENGTTFPSTHLTAMSDGILRSYTTPVSSGERSTTLVRYTDRSSFDPLSTNCLSLPVPATVRKGPAQPGAEESMQRE